MDTTRGRGRARGRGVVNGDAPPPGAAPTPPRVNGTNGHNGHNGDNAALAMANMNLEDGNQRGAGRGASRGARTRRTTDEMNASCDLVKTRSKELTSKQGTSGEVVKLMTNHFRFKTRPNFKLYQYRVDLNIEEDRTFVRKAIIHRAKENIRAKYVFDGTVMMTTEEVYPHLANPNGVTIDGTYLNADKQECPLGIKIKLVGEVHATDHHFIHFYNLLIKRNMDALNLKQMGRSHYDVIGKKEEKQWKLELYPGYTTSIRQHENEVLMVAEITHKIVHTSSVLDKMTELMSRSRGDMNIVKAAFIGTIVMTKYNNKTYRVDDMDLNTTASSTFPKKDNTHISYLEYYEQKYGIKVRDRKQPMLLSKPTEKDRRGGSNEPVMLVPELCVVTGMDDGMRANYKLMDSLAKYTKMDPPNRIERLQALSRRLTQDCKEGVKELADWGMKIDPELVKLDGRLLDAEKIIFNTVGQRIREESYNKWPMGDRDPGADWSSAVRNGLQSTVPIQKWMFVYPQRDFGNVDSFYKELQNVSRGLQLQIQEPKWVEVADTRTGTYIQKLKECVALLPHFIVVVIPSEKDQNYSAIKKLLCVESPCPSQVLTCSKVIGKPQKHRTFATKIAIQMTAKVGAIPWSVKIPLKNVMIVGFDTYHDTMRKGASWGAMVASLNTSFTRYFSDVSEHPSKQEMSDHIPTMFSAALRSFQKNNNALPKKVIFYRDGVGDGQLKQVLDHEVDALQKICEDGGFSLTFIVVNKRINTRFFANKGKGAFNPPSGTVVDSVVTLPERYDFFLISQSVRQGTVNPTSYNVIYDKSGLQPEHIQRLTYKLCHLYFNWTGTVRVPAPCQYAHKLAYVVGEAIHAKPHLALSETLYYL